jgi:mannose-6-phosphate isomerase-like protein (cupin superfamily)
MMQTELRSYVAGIVTGLGLAAAGAAAAATGGVAQAPKPAVPQKYDTKIVLENERVRVKDVTFLPGVKDPGMHTHELAHVGVVIQGGTLVFRYPDGKTETMKLDAGGAGYRGPNVSHEAINPGTAPVRVIEVELK